MNVTTASVAPPALLLNNLTAPALLLDNLTTATTTTILNALPNVTNGSAGGGIIGPPPKVFGGPPPFDVPNATQQLEEEQPIALPYLYDPPPILEEATRPPPDPSADYLYFDPPIPEEATAIPPELELLTVVGPDPAPVPLPVGTPTPTPEPEMAAFYFDPEIMEPPQLTLTTAAPTPYESFETAAMYFDPDPPTPVPETATADPEIPDIGGFYFDPEANPGGDGDGSGSDPEPPDIGGFYFDPNPPNGSTTGGFSFGYLPDPEPEGPTEENQGEGPSFSSSLQQNATDNATTVAGDYYDPDPPVDAVYFDPSRLQRPTSLSAYYSKHKTLAIIPHITGAMSMLGSGWIILDIARDRKKHGKVYHRLMLSMSAFDFLSSFWVMLSTIPVPADSTFIYGARGTTASCSAQGFFLQLNIATPLYNMFLSVYYLLLIGYQWCEGKIKREVEPKMHIVALVFALGTAIAGLVLKLYNPTLWCHIAAHPMNCNQSYRNGGVSDCIRGDNASVYMFAFYYGVLWFSILVATVSLFLVYWKVLSLERRTEKYQFHGSANSNKPPRGRKETRKKSLMVANLSLLYMLAFYLTWIFPTIAAIMYSADGGESFVVSLLAVTFLPLQGFFNMLIYVRPRYQQYRKKYSESSVFRVLGLVVRRTVSFWNSSEDDDPDDRDHELGTGVESESQSQSQSQPAGSDSEGESSSDVDGGDKANNLRPESEPGSFNDKVESEKDSSCDERDACVQVEIS